MDVQRWIARRETQWQKLESLLKHLETKGLKSLKADEIALLASLYRSVSADLARAKTNQLGEAVIQHLQALTSRSYSQIYQGSRKQEWRAAIAFYVWGFPEVVRESSAYIAIATGMFIIGALIAWWFAWRDPSFMSLVVPERLISLVRDRGELWMGSILGSEPLASSGIAINNMTVCFRTVAGGITGGLLTAYVLFFNGVLLGAIGALVQQNSLALPFWAFVFPHGALELPAIFLAGAAGLLIARALLFPNQYRRVDAFKIYGNQAARLMFGVVP
ncbi:MAG: stage II sporulation protein M, partial [Pseudanabaena sp.]